MVKKTKISSKRKKELNLEVASLAQEFRKSTIKTNKPIDNTFEILDSMGFFVLRFPSEDNDLSGFHIKKGDYDCIYINSSHTLGRQYFSAWHEVYHIITGNITSPSFFSNMSIDENEYKAECFASHILIPTQLLKHKISKEQINIRELKANQVVILQNYFNVSYTAMLMKIKEVYPEFKNNYLFKYKNNDYKEQLIKMTESVKGKLELIKPTNDFTIPKSFLQDINDNYNNNRISENKVAQLMNLLNESKARINDL